MKESLLKLLICPKCKSDLTLSVRRKDKEIVEGDLFCDTCNNHYPIHNYVPRFVMSDKYVTNFSMEWDLHRNTQLDSISGTGESERTFIEKTGFDLQMLKGKLILDAGCGSGRFMEIAAKYGAEVVGVDLSYAVDSAFANMGLNKIINIIQADIFDLPLKIESFDFIYSIGVLHHTPSTKDAFMHLPGLLKKNGEIAIWVYSDEPFTMTVYNRVSNFYRLFTTRMPLRMLYRLCHIAVPLYHLYKIKGLGHIFRVMLPLSIHPDPRWRVLDTFDWYSARYQWKHTYSEVAGWFKEAKLQDIVKLSFPVSMKGRR